MRIKLNLDFKTKNSSVVAILISASLKPVLSLLSCSTFSGKECQCRVAASVVLHGDDWSSTIVPFDLVQHEQRHQQPQQRCDCKAKQEAH